jgi:hypothetical protein
MCILNKDQIFDKGLSIQHEERIELNRKWENGKKIEMGGGV